MQNVKLAINNLKWFLKIDSFALLIDNFKLIFDSLCSPPAKALCGGQVCGFALESLP